MVQLSIIEIGISIMCLYLSHACHAGLKARNTSSMRAMSCYSDLMSRCLKACYNPFICPILSFRSPWANIYHPFDFFVVHDRYLCQPFGKDCCTMNVGGVLYFCTSIHNAIQCRATDKQGLNPSLIAYILRCTAIPV